MHVSLLMNAKGWQMHDRFLKLHSRWMTLIGEHLQDPQGQVLEYWRIEKASSVIILPIQNDQLILPPPPHRPGLGKTTWDFPGGRIPAEKQLDEIASTILQRELGVAAEEIACLTSLNSQGWAVNSSFPNQKLYGVVANLQPTAQISPAFIGAVYPITKEGMQSLLNSLTCLQCRAVLLEWRFTIASPYLFPSKRENHYHL